ENSEPQDSNVEKEYTGQAEAKESDAKVLPIPWSEKEYVVKIKVNVKNGKIVSVEDDSSPVGETNKPYFGLAIANFGKYIGKDVSKIKQSDIDKGEEGISVVSTASVTSRAIHNAVKDALNKAK
ncbi:MAG: FMN-binding protein, partial [Peptostreptococcus porci]|nr:FMN-binding protein [Peptostreptococcus porci]